ncbi:hypothetical protein ABBQ38_006865 [Trebouxia sp. C0009 RCD-2024]
MSKDLEDGEIEDGELPEELAEIFDADDGSGQPTEAALPKADSVAPKPDLSLTPEPATAPAGSPLTASVAPPDLSLLGLPSYDAPVHSYGSSMAFSAYGTAPYGASVPTQLPDWRQSHIRRSDPRGYSPSYSQDRDAKQYDESSSFDSRQGNSLVAVNESSDEGELHPVNRSVSSRTRNKGPARDIKTISASIKALTSKANVAAAMK